MRFAQYLQRKAFCRATNQLTLFVQALPKQIQLCCLQNSVRCPEHPAVLVAGQSAGAQLAMAALQHMGLLTGQGQTGVSRELGPGRASGGSNSCCQEGARIR